MLHKIPLPHASTLLLTSMLSAPGWADTLADIQYGGQLMIETFKDFAPKTDENGNLDHAWLREEATWELSEKQRETCKKAITALAKEAKIPLGLPSYQLLKAFGLES